MMHYALRLPHLVLGYSVPLPLPNIVAILIYGITNLTCSTKAGTGYQLHKHQHQLCTCKWKLAGAKAHGFLVLQYMLLAYRLCVHCPAGPLSL